MDRKFIKELNDFFKFLDSCYESDSLKYLLKNFTHLNFNKLSAFVYNSTKDYKEDILKHNAELFTVPRIFFPKLDISMIFNTMNPDQVNTFWEKFARIYIYCKCLNTSDQYENAETNDISISKLIKEYEENKKIDEENTFSILDIFIDGNILNDKIKNAEITDYSEFTDKIAEFLPSANDPNFKKQLNDMVKDIFEDLKNIDFTKHNLMDVIKTLAQKFADRFKCNTDSEFSKKITDIIGDFISSLKSGDTLEKLTKDADPETKKLVNMTSEFVKKTDLQGGDIGKIVENFNEFASSNIQELMKQKGLSDKKIQDIMNNPKNYGLDAKQLTSNNRKMKRTMKKINKK